jgi:hypothetical protein
MWLTKGEKCRLLLSIEEIPYIYSSISLKQKETFSPLSFPNGVWGDAYRHKHGYAPLAHV